MATISRGEKDFNSWSDAYSAALVYLNIRWHSEFELKQKLVKKGFSNSAIAEAYVQLRKEKFLNDERLASQFVHSCIQGKSWGPLMIKQKLLQHGVPSSFVDKALQEEYSTAQQVEVAKRFLKRLNLEGKEKIEIRNLVARRLQTRGFSASIVSKVLNSI